MEHHLGLDELLDPGDTLRLVFRLALELLCTFVIVHWVYQRRYRSSDHVFTFWIFGIVTFSIAFLLRKVPMELGFALGLFAVFSVLRYRTESIGIKDLTYLFLVIGLALINALVNKKVSLAELLIVDFAIIAAVILIDGPQRSTHEDRVRVVFDRVDLLGAGSRSELHTELARRLGFTPSHVVVHEVDLLRDTAQLSVYYQAATAPAVASVSPEPSADATRRRRAQDRLTPCPPHITTGQKDSPSPPCA